MIRCLKGFCFLVVLLAHTADLYACTCNGRSRTDPLAKVVARTDLVFEGDVVKIDTVAYIFDWLQVHIAVQRVWKGGDSTTIVVETPVGSSLCGYPFVLEESYLVFASVNGNDGSVSTSLCGRTRLLRHAADDLAALAAGAAVGLEDAEPPSAFALTQNYPNPFNPATRITFTLERSAFVVLQVYDMQGRRTRKLINRFEGAGEHTVWFEAGALPSGLYVYELIAGDEKARRLMMLVR